MTSPATRRNKRRIEERRGQTTTAAGRVGGAVDCCRSNLNTMYQYYITNPFVFDSSSCVLSSAPHPRNERRPSAHFSCRPPRRRSPTPLIVTKYSAPGQHAPSAVLLLRRSRTLRTAPPGRDPLHTASSQPTISSIGATEEEVQPPRPRGPTKGRKRRRRAMFKD